MSKGKFKTHGYHAIIECYGYISQMQSKEVEKHLIEAAVIARATVLNSKIHAFGEGYGVTGVVMLAESHISIHTWPESDYAALDIFMCGKKDNLLDAVNYLKSINSGGSTSFRIIEGGRGEIEEVE